jgi:hypothetical protein
VFGIEHGEDPEDVAPADGEEPDEPEGPDEPPVPFGGLSTGTLFSGTLASGAAAILTIGPAMDLPLRETSLAPRLAYTAWPTRRLDKSFASVSLNTNV